MHHGRLQITDCRLALIEAHNVGGQINQLYKDARPNRPDRQTLKVLTCAKGAAMHRARIAAKMLEASVQALVLHIPDLDVCVVFNSNTNADKDIINVFCNMGQNPDEHAVDAHLTMSAEQQADVWPLIDLFFTLSGFNHDSRSFKHSAAYARSYKRAKS